MRISFIDFFQTANFNAEVTMNDDIQTFYYSRKKLGLYLLFNIVLLVLAVFFTLTIFPEYPAVYIFAVSACALSVFGALFVFLVPLPLAVITAKDIKIDRNAPVEWKNIRSVRKVYLGYGPFRKSILRLNPGKLPEYHMNLMQKICANSEFGAFSIPLYAMNQADSKEIEKVIKGLAKPIKRAATKTKTKTKTAAKAPLKIKRRSSKTVKNN